MKESANGDDGVGCKGKEWEEYQTEPSEAVC